jgi:hypothetical protein
VSAEPSTPGPSHWFTLDWIERITEEDPHAPWTRGEDLPTRQRNLHYARRIGGTSLGAVERLRDWHLTHDSWIPPEASREYGFEPHVSEIYDRNDRRAK